MKKLNILELDGLEGQFMLQMKALWDKCSHDDETFIHSLKAISPIIYIDEVAEFWLNTMKTMPIIMAPNNTNDN